MKLATPLSERADLQGRLSEIGMRLNINAKVQEGEEPSESLETLMEELDRTIGRIEELMARINLTNSSTRRDGKTITELLAHRDCLKSKIRILRDFLDNASSKVSRMTHTEIKNKSTVPVAALQNWKDIDDEYVRAFFSIKYAGRGDLFQNLSIWQEEAYRKAGTVSS